MATTTGTTSVQTLLVLRAIEGVEKPLPGGRTGTRIVQDSRLLIATVKRLDRIAERREDRAEREQALRFDRTLLARFAERIADPARPLRWSLVRSNVDGFAANAWGFHPLSAMAIIPR